nr:hypothetical protein [Tanacetum cinerariifolium]
CIRPDRAGAFPISEMYETDALASSWGCPKTKLLCENEKWDIPIVKCMPQTRSWGHKTSGSLTETPFEDFADNVPVTFRVHFVLLLFILFTFPFFLHHMSSGSQNPGDVVVSKFDMHVYTSVLTSDEVKNIVAEYATPLDLHPCVPPSMNRLSVDKIDAMPWRNQDSSVADPAPTGVRAEDILRLCENVIDLRPVHPAMLYAVGLTIWKHVGHHLVFKDSEGTVATSMSQFLKFPMVGGVCVGKGTALTANKVIPQHTTPPFPFRKAKARAVRKRAATARASQRTKKKTSPLSFALSDFEADESNRSGSDTHHSASPLNTIIPNEAELVTGGDGLILKSVNQAEEDTDQPLNNVEDTTKVNSLLSEHSPYFQHSNPSDEDTHNVRSKPAYTHASGSTGHRPLTFFVAGSSLRRDVGLPEPFVSAWNLTTHSILNDAESYQDMMINLATLAVRSQQSRLSDYKALQRSWFELGCGALAQIDILQWYEALNEDYGELFESYRSCRGVFDRKEADLTEKLAAMEKARDDLLDKDQEREERIKQLEADLASKTSSLIESEVVVNTLKGDLECLTVDLNQAKIVRHNYVRQLLSTVVQRLLSSGEYKKSLTDVFNLPIAVGWSEGVKAACSEEEAEAFLAIAIDYDPARKDTFMSEFDSLFDKSYLHVEKLVESFRLPFGRTCKIYGQKVPGLP